MKKISNAIGYILLFLSFVIICLTIWTQANFYVSNFEAILITLSMPLDGTDPDVIYRGIKYCLCTPLLLIILTYLFLKITTSIKKDNIIKKIFLFIKKHLNIISLCVLLATIVFSLIQFNFVTFIKSRFDKTTIYEEKYTDPKLVHFTFPEKKRNLIFIYLESIETTFYDKESGGGLDENVIPELYEISKSGITFTDINHQGYYSAPNADYTLGCDVASSSGTILSTLFMKNLILSKNIVLPGVYALGDVLHDNGYKNILMIGSSAKFGGTDNYYYNHGQYEFKDYQYAIDKGYIPNDYKVFWGYEDKKLFEFAKIEILSLAESNEPFNFTIKTIDTHSPGYICEDCVNKYSQQYLNVLSCSSRIVSSFIEWLQQQEFYNNTTVVIMGDHISMDKSISSLVDKKYVRKPYFVILNSAIPNKNNNRAFSTLDIYPTIIASLGITYDSDRLGLGTNLFSNTRTLLEEMGDDFFKEIIKSSDYYKSHLLKNN